MREEHGEMKACRSSIYHHLSWSLQCSKCLKDEIGQRSVISVETEYYCTEYYLKAICDSNSLFIHLDVLFRKTAKNWLTHIYPDSTGSKGDTVTEFWTNPHPLRSSPSSQFTGRRLTFSQVNSLLVRPSSEATTSATCLPHTVEASRCPLVQRPFCYWHQTRKPWTLIF